MNRFFTDEPLVEGGTVTIEGEDAKHITRVLRLEKGDRVELCDKNAAECDAVITDTEKERVRLRAENVRRSTAEPITEVTLFQCLPKSGKMELIIQKCVEMGVHSIVPVSSARCVVKLDKKDSAARIQRYNRIAYEAAKQSKRGRVPEVKSVTELKKCALDGFDLVLTAYELEKETTLKRALTAHRDARRIAVFIGPEGGFEAEEVNWLAERWDAISVSLGSRILRTETAGMAVVAMLLYELEG